MNGMPRFIQSALDFFIQVPVEVARWSTTIDDRTFLQVMFVGAIVLAAVIAKSLR